MAGTGYKAIALTDLPRKPNGTLVTGAWRYLVGCHSSVTGLFDALLAGGPERAAEACPLPVWQPRSHS